MTNPAQKAAELAELELKKIEVPRISTDAMKPFAEVAAIYAMIMQKLHAAEREIERLMAERLAREKRIALLESIKAATEPLDVWCVNYDEGLAAGAVVETMEVPGFWKEEGSARTTNLYDKTPEKRRTVSWVERSWNIAVRGVLGDPVGQLTPAEALTDAGVFVNCALEPGHLKWRPRWRYGVITAMTGDTAAVSFAEELARPLPDEPEMSLHRTYNYAGIPIRYPPCGSGVFTVGDEVFVLFEGVDRDQPVIIGFRREPRTCSGRQSWLQIV